MKIPNIRGKLKDFNLKSVFSGKENWLIILAVVGLALFLRIWQLDSIPPGFSENERAVVDQISYINLNKLWLGGEFYKAAYLYLAKIAVTLFGYKIIVLRALSAFFGTLTVWLSYIFISKWFSQKIAIFTAFLFAVSSFHITLSRLIAPEIMFPVVLLALFITLTSAYRNKNMWTFGLAGVFAALGLYTSPAFLAVPFLFIISGIYFFLKNKKFFLAYQHELLIFFLAFLAFSIPYFASFFLNPMSYLTFFGFNRSVWQIVMNIGQIPNLLFNATPPNFYLNIGTEPLLDPFIFVTAVTGFLFALFNINRRKYFFMIVWLVAFSVYAALKRGVQIIDLVGILPVLYAFSALILDYVIDRWFETFPLNRNARIAIVALIAIFFALSALYNFDRYFVAYKNSKEVSREFSAPTSVPLK